MTKLKPLKIFGKKVKVKLGDLKDHNLEGYFDPTKSEITICNLSEAKFQTYAHELFHSVWHRMGMNQTSVRYDVQELIVESFATALEENFKEIVHAHDLFKKMKAPRK